VGTIVGSYYGSITTFDVPRKGYQTAPVSLNDWGQTTGIVYDANFVTHGLYGVP
jgi:hypothetical protein